MKTSSKKFQDAEPEVYAHISAVVTAWHHHDFVEGEIIQGISGQVKVTNINYKDDGEIKNVIMEPVK